MTHRPTRPEARVIPLRLIGQTTLRPADAAALFRTGTRTIRPIDAVLLSPILVPVTLIVLLLLLAWFVLWLAAVGSLVTFNLIGDLSSVAANSVRSLSSPSRIFPTWTA
jgi:hypothetical protein